MKRFDVFAYLDEQAASTSAPSEYEAEFEVEVYHPNSFFEEESEITTKAIKALQRIRQLHQTKECPTNRLFHDQRQELMRELTASGSVLTPNPS